ncbi:MULTISPECIES: hypothetical protein [unclassified Okeania]|nr:MULTISPECIES: hypothetical protein [unclassified Okeania]
MGQGRLGGQGRSPLFLLIKSWASNKGEKLSPIQGFGYRKKLE